MDFPDRLLRRLKQTPLTANLSDSEQQQLLELSSYCEAQAGQLVFVEGSPSDHLWVLLEGEGERLQEADSGQLLLLGGVRAGETLAALDFLLERPYSSSFRATAESSLLMIHRQHWQRLLTASRVGSKLALTLVAMAQQHFEQGLAATDELLQMYQQAIAPLQPPVSSEEADDPRWVQIQQSRDRLEKQQQMLRKQLPLVAVPPTRSPSRWGPFLAGTVTGMVIMGLIGAIAYAATGLGSSQQNRETSSQAIRSPQLDDGWVSSDGSGLNDVQ
ncbi:cyclic nucleotide-binding domain-containing protein [Geitlerinema sp. P-1104]|uniref:Crp/Fnr family transcriptional regulator n=1 Tax=Geitlerinema sp. P-1104 TaxID=2546230 RepID=UPI0014776ECC|nr:cyclic nucleotide-binding domain-containing protein [Geitlerinema sp. P-1104]NMG57004.1 cyclic nucleotide-binding domain-containing protein [Geitlerinema sp. P-1104]